MTDRTKLQIQGSELVIQPPGSDSSSFDMGAALCEGLAVLSTLGQEKEWQRAEELVRDLKPLPAFICNTIRTLYNGGFVACNSDQSMSVRRVLFAVASDRILGADRRINTVSEAQAVCSAHTVAAAALIYSCSKLMSNYHNERFWRQTLAEAVLRAEIGYRLCKRAKISPDKGLLCGFGSRIGAAWQIASGDAMSAGAWQEQIAGGGSWAEIGKAVYGSDPWHVAALFFVGAGIPVQEVKEIVAAKELSNLIDQVTDILLHIRERRNHLYYSKRELLALDNWASNLGLFAMT